MMKSYELLMHTDLFLQFVSSMVKSYEKILAAHCRQYQSWIFAPARDTYRRLALYMLEDLFPSGLSDPSALLNPLSAHLVF